MKAVSHSTYASELWTNTIKPVLTDHSLTLVMGTVVSIALIYFASTCFCNREPKILKKEEPEPQSSESKILALEEPEPQSSQITLQLKALDEENIQSIDVERNEKIEILAQRWQGTQTTKARFIWKGKQLNTEMTFNDYKIQDKDLIHLVFRKKIDL